MDLKAAPRQWRSGNYLISTDVDLIPVEEVNKAFATEEVYWTGALPPDVLDATLRNSLCFGLYETTADRHQDSSLRFVGLARCITDYTTFLYMTDVWVEPCCQGQGLGKWLVGCVQEVIVAMPHLRRSMLLTGDWKRSVPFYERNMDMTVAEGRRTDDERGGVGFAVLMRKGRGHP